MTYETQAFLLDVGIDYWLAGFQTVGEAIDIVRTNLRRPGIIMIFLPSGMALIESSSVT